MWGDTGKILGGTTWEMEGIGEMRGAQVRDGDTRDSGRGDTRDLRG